MNLGLRLPSKPAASPVQAQVEPQERAKSGNPPVVTSITGNAVDAPINERERVTVSQLITMDLHNERGDRIGDVERVVQSADGKFHIVIGTGGFLGMRERDVRIPLDDGLTIRSDRLVIKGLTDDQVKAMPAFNSSDRSYRNLARDATVRLDRDQSED
jgi:PRC-barrel domain